MTVIIPQLLIRKNHLTRTVFFISDGTGITAETLGRSLLSQFERVAFDYVTIPSVNTKEKAMLALEKIEQANVLHGKRPIVFTTLVNAEISQLFNKPSGLFIDFFQTFINPLERELGCQSSHTVGKSHGVKNDLDYMARISAVNYALAYDDGVNLGDYHHADVILVGVSRSGKTPTCLFLGLQFGIFAANYPLTEEDVGQFVLPTPLKKYQQKVFGLTIDPIRLHKIRQERLPNRPYAALRRCETEVQFAEVLFKRNNIPYLDTTSRSIEEIAAEIMTIANIKRRIK